MIPIEEFTRFKSVFLKCAEDRGIRIVKVSNSKVRYYPLRCSSKVGIKTDSVDQTIALLKEMGYPGATHHLVYNRGHGVIVDLKEHRK
jgi:hypothetical protein